MTARVDIGAVEYGSVALLAGDGNLDMSVDGLDYLLWADHIDDDPAEDPPGVPQNGDYNADGRVDSLDYLVWATNYGAHFTAGQASSGTRAAATVAAQHRAAHTMSLVAQTRQTFDAAAGGSLPYISSGYNLRVLRDWVVRNGGRREPALHI